MAAGEIRLRGSYTTQRDGGVTYDYDGYCFRLDDRIIIWRSRISANGGARRMVEGQITRSTLREITPIRDAVRTAISHAIETLK